MFEVGKRYNFKTVERDGYSTWNATVLAVEGPLLKLLEDGKEWVFNTNCFNFELAKLNEQKPFDVGDLVINLTDKDGNQTQYRPGKDEAHGEA